MFSQKTNELLEQIKAIDITIKDLISKIKDSGFKIEDKPNKDADPAKFAEWSFNYGRWLSLHTRRNVLVDKLGESSIEDGKVSGACEHVISHDPVYIQMAGRASLKASASNPTDKAMEREHKLFMKREFQEMVGKFGRREAVRRRKMLLDTNEAYDRDHKVNAKRAALQSIKWDSATFHQIEDFYKIAKSYNIVDRTL